MPFHYGLGYLAIVTIPIVVGVAVVVAAIKGKLPILTILFITPIGMLLTFVLTTFIVVRCSNSYDVVLAAKKLLNPTERKTLHGAGFICPNVYTFQRAGKKTCLVSDGDGGAFVGCG